MVNRINLKKGIDEEGNEKYASELIKKYLRLEGEKQFGEIKKYLIEREVKFYDDKGFDKTLKSLMKKDEIGKHKVYGKTYPQYHIKTKGLDRIIAIAQEFQHKIIWEIDEMYPKHKNYGTDKKKLVKDLIYVYGLYNLYVQIKSWEFTDEQKSHKENSDIRNAWLRNTLPLGNESRIFEEGIRELISSKDSSKIYEDREKQKKVLELEQSLKRSHSSAMKLLNKEFEYSKQKHGQKIKK